VEDTTYPLGGLGSRWSVAGAIHSGRDDEVRGRRSPSFLSSSSRHSIIDDGRQSSAVMSLTGIFRGKETDFATARGCARVRWQGGRGKNRGRKWKERWQGDLRIFIDGNHQRTDPANAVTPLVNTPPNGTYSSHGQGATNSTPVQCRHGSRLKRRTQRAKRRTAAIPPFPCKLRYVFVTMKISRGHRLTHRTGSTADLEYQSQGCPASGRKARPTSRTHWGCPRRGRDGQKGSPQGEASNRWTLLNETSNDDHIDSAL